MIKTLYYNFRKKLGYRTIQHKMMNAALIQESNIPREYIEGGGGGGVAN